MRSVIAAVLTSLGITAAAEAQDHARVPLWPNGAPGSEARRRVRVDRERMGRLGRLGNQLLV